MSQHPVVVVGAGHAGVSVGLALKDLGIRALVVDRADRVGSSWRGRYDRLRLNSCRPTSKLPDRRYAKGTPMFPTRDHVIENLERHVAAAGLDLKLGTEVRRIDRDDGGWVVETSADGIAAPHVVVSTGHENEPLIPDWAGRDSFQGELIHSALYKNPGPFQGRKVLVVGPASSGMEIAQDLAEGGAQKVWLSARTPPNILLREGPGGLPGDMVGVLLFRFPSRVGDAVARFGSKMDVGDLSEYGLPAPDEGVFSRLHRLGAAPAIVDKDVIEAIKARRFEIVRGVESLDATGVQLADGGRVEPDAVICATGFRRGLEPLVGHLGVLDPHGSPHVVGERPAAEGLRFVGYVPRPGGLGYAAKEAKRAAKAIARELAGTSMS